MTLNTLLFAALLIQSPAETDQAATSVSFTRTIAPADTVQITEWLVPWEKTRPRDPYVAPDGRVWFCGQAGGYVAVLDQGTGEFKRYDLGEGAGPHNLIVDKSGFVWYAGNRRGHIGRLDPVNGDIEIFPMPVDAAGDPHTLIFDKDGNIWFTVQFSNFVGHLDTDTGKVRLIEVQTERARPYGIVLDSKGTPWIALFGTNRLGRLDPESMTLAEIVLPRDDARPRRLAVTSDDRVWYVDYGQGYLGRYDPVSGQFKEWPLPTGSGAKPYGMAVDSEDRLWFVDGSTDPNLFMGFDAATESFLGSTAIPSGGRTVRHMYFHPTTQTVWFGTDTNYVGKAVLPDRNVAPRSDI